ncbi:14850_t:CDS:2 [Acaulospora colombiana]|uniref:14850_t:CDS:1 n=1 Tax=Acaulospora colombiana TaxID=27376 RepID=A0ACA9KWA9_9GLOM|nr:14850_t:CDS:2 [Acaulospora colombiana]
MESNLVTLCTFLRSEFGQNPPVYAKPITKTSSSLQPPTNGGQNTLKSPIIHPRSLNPITPPPLPPPPPYQQNAYKKDNIPRNNSGRPTQTPPFSQQQVGSVPISASFGDSILDAPPTPCIVPPAPLPMTQNPELVKLQSVVYDKVKQDCGEYVQKLSPEFHKLMVIGDLLSQSQERVNMERANLLARESKIGEESDYIKSKIVEIDGLVEKAKNMAEASVDEVLCGTTIVYNQ